MAIEVFNRREIKYLLSDDEKNSLLNIIEDHMERDPYNHNGQTYKICNLYLDTEADELIRKSLEKPVFKEKSDYAVTEEFLWMRLFIWRARKNLMTL